MTRKKNDWLNNEMNIQFFLNRSPQISGLFLVTNDSLPVVERGLQPLPLARNITTTSLSRTADWQPAPDITISPNVKDGLITYQEAASGRSHGR